MPDTQLTLTDGELAALKGMVTDWVNERLAEPPYPDEFTSVIEKLEMPEHVMTAAQEPLAPPCPNLG